MEERRRVLSEVFGESESEDEYQQHYFVEETGFQPSLRTILRWKRIIEINGLWICTDFLSHQQQSSLLSAVQNEGLFTAASENQAMKFGNFPAWANELSDCIREAVISGDCYLSESVRFPTFDGQRQISPLPSNLLWREPLFDQLIVNVYQPGEGICAHVDLLRFEDGIAIVSLESPCVMHFSPVAEEPGFSGNEGEDGINLAAITVPVYLAPGSLVVISGEARYLWKHEINRKEAGFQLREEGGGEIIQRRRISITLRKLCPDE